MKTSTRHSTQASNHKPQSHVSKGSEPWRARTSKFRVPCRAMPDCRLNCRKLLRRKHAASVVRSSSSRVLPLPVLLPLPMPAPLPLLLLFRLCSTYYLFLLWWHHYDHHHYHWLALTLALTQSLAPALNYHSYSYGPTSPPIPPTTPTPTLLPPRR